MKFEDLTGRRVVIWGTGREGRAAHAELTKRGIEAIFAVTTADAEPLDLAAEVVGPDHRGQRVLGRGEGLLGPS